MQKRPAVDLRIEIVGLYDQGELRGGCTSADVARVLDASPMAVAMAFRALGFGLRKEGKVSTWTPPAEWPPVVLLQRTLRRAGVSASRATAVLNSAAVPVDVLAAAMGLLQGAGVPLAERGRLRQTINGVLDEERERWERRKL